MTMSPKFPPDVERLAGGTQQTSNHVFINPYLDPSVQGISLIGVSGRSYPPPKEVGDQRLDSSNALEKKDATKSMPSVNLYKGKQLSNSAAGSSEISYLLLLESKPVTVDLNLPSSTQERFNAADPGKVTGQKLNLENKNKKIKKKKKKKKNSPKKVEQKDAPDTKSTSAVNLYYKERKPIDLSRVTDVRIRYNDDPGQRLDSFDAHEKEDAPEKQDVTKSTPAMNLYHKEKEFSDFFVSKALGGSYHLTPSRHVAGQKLESPRKEDVPHDPDSTKMNTFSTGPERLVTQPALSSNLSDLKHINKAAGRYNVDPDKVEGQRLSSSNDAREKKDVSEKKEVTKSSTPTTALSHAIEISASKIPLAAVTNPSPEDTKDNLFCCGFTLTMSTSNDTGKADLSALDRLKLTLVFLFDTLPRYLYDNLLLHIPALYSYRVSRIIHDAKLALPEVKKLYHSRNSSKSTDEPISTIGATPLKPSLSVGEFKSIWVEFVDSLIGEWNTLNVVSVLLFSALLTLLQIDGAGNDPVTRSMGLIALLCALWSLIFGCIYVIRFGTMKHTHQALTWAEDVQKTSMSIWWNVWILLAMPAVWLAWSLILFLGCILSFTWRTGSIQSPPSTGSFTALAPGPALAVRVVITIIFGFGVTYLVLIINTLHDYGASMDEKWMAKVTSWVSAIEEDR